MRRLTLLLCALLLAVGAWAPKLMTAAPALAASDCTPSQPDDLVVEDTALYRSARYWVWDVTAPDGRGHWIDIDLKAYHVSAYGTCWKSNYASVWSEDGTSFWVGTQLRVWVCGQGPWSFQDGRGPQWTNNAAITPQGAWGPSTWIVRNVQMWNGVWVGVSFAPYGSWTTGMCGPQADSYRSTAEGQYWYNPGGIASIPGNPWYVSGW